MKKSKRRKLKPPPIIPVRRDRFTAKDNKYAALLSRITPDLGIVLLNRYLAVQLGLEEAIVLMQYVEFIQDFPSGNHWFSLFKEDLPYIFPFIKTPIKEVEDNLIARNLITRTESTDLFTYQVMYETIAEVLYTFEHADGTKELVNPEG